MNADEGRQETGGAAESAEARFERSARERLRESADSLDAHVRSRLTQARFAAVEEARRRPGGTPWRVLIPAASLASAAAVAVILWTTQPGANGSLEAHAVTPLDDLELLAGTESFEMLEELEFYEWVASAPVADEPEIG